MIDTGHMIMNKDFILGDPMLPPPFCPEGFERAEDNEFVLLRKLPDCEDRRTVTKTKACCGELKQIFCEREKKSVTRKECLDCDVTIVATGG